MALSLAIRRFAIPRVISATSSLTSRAFSSDKPPFSIMANQPNNGVDTISKGSIEVCRIMVPDDANIAGNVHGGTTLKLLEEAGYIIATRHLNKNRSPDAPKNDFIASLARVERTDFLQPLFIGEVAQVHADLSYASKHSLEVKVSVWAENLVTGQRRLANRAALWYVPVKYSGRSADEPRVIGEVPPLNYASEAEEELGKARYEAQKKDRLQRQEHLTNSQHTVSASQSSLIHSVQPSDCGFYGYLYGGVAMKMMDEVAGITAFRHCKTNVVTASIDAIDFHKFVKVGHIINMNGFVTFTSSRSMEIEVILDAQDLMTGTCFRACTAFFTYVSLDANHKPQPVPQIILTTEEEKQKYEEGKKRYEERKKRRLSAH
ncbi:predicted protein [Nematostella vectensis]|uniref:HotDog ACOT-type domain-containing protein n=1 Tax=Nematostella vectensis TaxID=45351 RepID=A7SEP0_NEMVE|nr:predicted protein [Nematostella vectensis]|eukprot:XP_001629911.1 predicted protein [Nematostella vectensis]